MAAHSTAKHKFISGGPLHPSPTSTLQRSGSLSFTSTSLADQADIDLINKIKQEISNLESWLATQTVSNRPPQEGIADATGNNLNASIKALIRTRQQLLTTLQLASPDTEQ